MEASEDLNSATVVELGTHSVDDRDVPAAGSGPEALYGEERRGCLSRGVVAELESAGRVVLDALGGETDVGLGVSEESVGDVL